MTRFINRKELCELTGLSYPTIWAMMRKNNFPRGKVLKPQLVRWNLEEVKEWIENCPAQRLKGDKE